MSPSLGWEKVFQFAAHCVACFSSIFCLLPCDIFPLNQHQHWIFKFECEQIRIKFRQTWEATSMLQSSSFSFLFFLPASEWELLCHTCLVGNLSNDGTTWGGGWRGAVIVMFEGEKGVLSIHKRRTDVNVNWPFFCAHLHSERTTLGIRIRQQNFIFFSHPFLLNSEQTNNSFILGGTFFASFHVLSGRTQGWRNFCDLTSHRTHLNT